MAFEYEVYFRQNCLVPLFLFSFSLICLITALFGFFFDLKAKKYKISPLVIARMISFLLIFFAVATPNLIQLLRGGAFLLFEREKDAVVIEGYVEERQDLSFYSGYRYNYDQNNGNGQMIQVNGEKYYLMTYGNLKDGDYVWIKILPKSRLILEIHILDCVENGLR